MRRRVYRLWVPIATPGIEPSRELADAGDGRGDTLARALDWLLRSDGRSPSVNVAACLSLEGCALHAVLADAPAHAGAAPPDRHGAVCHLAVHACGRAHLSLVRPGSDELEPRAWTDVSLAQLAAIERARKELTERARAADAEVDALLDALSPSGFTELIHAACDAVDHNDPVLLFVDDALFSNVDHHNTLWPKPGNPPDDHYILSRLQHSSRHACSIAERRFLGVFLLLREAQLRAEELNGRQFTPWALATFFEQKHEQYLLALSQAGSNEAIDAWPQGLAARATWLGRAKQRVQLTHRVYRWIDGITLRKEERWRLRDAPALADELPAAIAQHGLERFGVQVDGRQHHDAFFLELMRRIARIDDESTRSAAFEELLEVVVRAAMHAVPSPIGMTRGMRDLRHFQDAIEAGRFAEVCATPLDDGFCAVFARQDAPLYGQPLAKILRAISRRMQFNHRHYLPGHFDAADVPERPHFYYPPTMSDIAENGEHRHTGHALARVRHSIRSPAPLWIAGRNWPGLVDIRMMRTVGHPYTEADLVTVDTYMEYIRSIAQAALTLKSEGLRAPVVRLDPSLYERRYPPSAVPASPTPAQNAARHSARGISHMLRQAMEQHGQLGAITCAVTGRVLTLADARGVAERLAALTAGRPGCRVGLLCDDRAHQALFIVAGLAAGLVVCPLDPAMPARALEALLRHAAPDVVITDAGARPPPGVPAHSMLHAEDLLSGAAPGGALSESGSGGLLIYTSGATGLPKGVLLDEAQIGANVAFAREHFGYDVEPRWTSGCLLPLHHTFAIVSDLLPVLCAAGRVVVLPGFSATDAGSVATAFDRYAVRSFSAVPIVLEALLALSVPLPASLAFAITGAAALSERTRTRYRERHGHPVVPCYGLTESVCFATASPVGGGRPGSAGRAAGIAIRIVGEDLQSMPIGEHGEIALRGRSVITSYYRSNACTEPSAEHADACCDDGWFLTGDIGKLDADGYLFITGRRKNMLIRGGEKLYLEDLDRCLEEHAAVAEACSVQVPGLFGFERAVTFVVARGASGGSAEANDAICAFVRERLGARSVPDELRWTERIPRSATGKPLRAALRARCTGEA